MSGVNHYKNMNKAKKMIKHLEWHLKNYLMPIYIDLL